MKNARGHVHPSVFNTLKYFTETVTLEHFLKLSCIIVFFLTTVLV